MPSAVDLNNSIHHALFLTRKVNDMQSSPFGSRMLTCGAAVVAVAGVTMLGVTPSAQATTVPAARAATTTTGSIHRLNSTQCSVTGTLKTTGGQPIGGAVLQILRNGAKPPTQSKTTNASGQATFTVTAGVGGSVFFVVNFPGNNNDIASQSKHLTC